MLLFIFKWIQQSYQFQCFSTQIKRKDSLKSDQENFNSYRNYMLKIQKLMTDETQIEYFV